MKKITWFVAIFLITGFTVRAQRAGLEVKAPRGIFMRIKINHRPMFRGWRSGFGTSHLRPGRYELQIRVAGEPRIIRRIVNLRPHSLKIFRIVPGPYGFRLVETGSLILQETYEANQLECRNGEYYGRPVANARTFRRIRIRIRQEAFDDERLDLIKYFVRTYLMTSRQVKNLMLMLDFDENRLRLAEYAYRYVYDPENYWQTADALTFSSNRERLEDFIMEWVPDDDRAYSQTQW